MKASNILGLFLFCLLAPSWGLADPCTPIIDQGMNSEMKLDGEIFQFGLQIDVLGSVLTAGDCLVVGAAESTGDPFLFAALTGFGGYETPPLSDPVFGNGSAWVSEAGNFQSLGYSDPMGRAQEIKLLSLDEDGVVRANITFWDEGKGPLTELFEWDLTPDTLLKLSAVRGFKVDSSSVPEVYAGALLLIGAALLRKRLVHA